MIPREILKKIRQIELRTNRLVTETLAGISFQPSPQFLRIPRAVKDGNHGENVVLDCEVDAVSFESFQANFARSATHFAEKLWLKLRAVHCLQNFLCKFLSQARSFIFIPNNGLKEFGLRFRLKERVELHHQPKRCRISALTCSNGMPRRGFFSNSARRRSNSAACSGVKSGSYPSSRRSSFSFCASSIRSASGRVFASLNNSAALMELNLPAKNLFASA